MSLFSFFLGIQFDSSVPQTKMVSAVEPAPANDERMQGTLSHTCVRSQAVLGPDEKNCTLFAVICTGQQ